MRFGNTKGEIRVKKGDFRGDLGQFGNQPPHPPIFGKVKKKCFFSSSLTFDKPNVRIAVRIAPGLWSAPLASTTFPHALAAPASTTYI